MINSIYVCRHCGCEYIEELAWARTNTKEFADWQENSSGFYCPECRIYYKEGPMEQTDYQEKKDGKDD